MPLPLLAHQAPVLPLKLWRPAAFCGTALVIGSLAPDLQYLRMEVRADRSLGFGHSLLGQLVFCLPITLAVVLLVGRLRLGEVLVARLGARFRWLAQCATDVSRPGGLRRAAVSALVGSISHVVLDAITHKPARRLPHSWAFTLLGVRFGPTTIAQLVMSVVCGFFALWFLREIARRTTNECPAPRPGLAVIALLALVGAALGVLRALPAIQDPDMYFDAGPFYVWGLVVFFAACGAAAGVLLAGVGLAAFDRVKPHTAGQSPGSGGVAADGKEP